MKVLSWDVGIKNLAYCNLEYKEDIVTIKSWNKLDLLEDKRNIFKCKICNKNATLVGLDSNNILNYFCGTHKTKYVAIHDKTWDNFDNHIGICTYMTNKNKVCNKKSLWKKNNNTFCTIHKKQYIKTIQNDTKLKSIKKLNSLKNDPQELGTCIFKKLDNYPEILDCNTVCIEHQPVLKNPIMKSVAMFVFSYFLLRGTMENKINKVQFISASNKLKVEDNKIDEVVNKSFENTKIKNLIITLIKKYNKDIEITDLLIQNTIKYLVNKQITENIELYKKIEKDNKNYDLNKDISVIYTKVLLKDQPLWLTHLETYDKKDDLCDAFLQGYYFIKK